MRRSLIIFIFCIAIFIALASYLKIPIASATGGPTDGDAITVKVLVIAYDPFLEAFSGKRLSKYFEEDIYQGTQGDQSPSATTTKIMNTLEAESHGKIKYQMVESMTVLDEWPLHLNGQRYTDTQYLSEYNDHLLNNTPFTLGPVNYNFIIDSFNIDERINNGEIDEVWLWGGPGFGWGESAMAGNGAYPVNHDPILGVNTKPFVLMGFNFERTENEALESYGHRMEWIMKRVYGSMHFPAGPPPPSAPAILHTWDQFTIKAYDPGTLVGCGDAHAGLNFETWDPSVEYNAWSTNLVDSMCPNWLNNFPYLIGTPVPVNCNTWDGSGTCPVDTTLDYIKWWYRHMPHVAGSMDGYLNNWWRYYTDLETYKNKPRIMNDSMIVQEDFSELNYQTWGTDFCSQGANCAADDTSQKVVGNASIKVLGTDVGSNALWYNAVWAEQRVPGNWNVDPNGYFTFWARLANATSQNGPFTLLLCDDIFNQQAGEYNCYKYVSANDLLNSQIGNWVKFDVPLAGGSGWTRTIIGSPNFTNIDQMGLQYGNPLPLGNDFNLDGFGFTNIYGQYTDLSEDTNNSNWLCTVNGAGTCATTHDTSVKYYGVGSRKINTNGQGDVSLSYPAAQNANWNATNQTFAFWAFSVNPNVNGFENGSPKIVLKTNANNYYTYVPVVNVMNAALGRWQRFEIPLNGNSTYWTRIATGSPNLADIDWVEIHTDTSGTTAYDIYYDTMGFRASDVTAPSVSIASPANGANVGGTVQINVTASDDVALKRVDYFVDGNYVETDALTPYIFFWDSSTVTAGSHSLTMKAYDMFDNVTTSNAISVTTSGSDGIFSDDFEAGNLNAWSALVDSGNKLSVTSASALHGTKGLATLIDNTNDKYLVDLNVNDESSYRARFYLDPNSLTMASADTFSVFSGRNSAGSAFHVQLNYSSSSGYRIRTQMYNDAGTVLNGSWVNISDGSHSIEVYWKAATAAGANDGFITLWIDGTVSGSQTLVDNDTKRIGEARFGAVANLDPGTSGTFYLDDFVSRKTTYIGPIGSPPDTIFLDGFESGTTGAWSSETDAENDLSVTVASALDGTKGLSALVDNLTDMYVTDTTPQAETRYRARFYLDPNSITMASADTFNVFAGRNSAGTAVNVQLNYSSTNGYRVRTAYYNDAASQVGGTYFNITDAPHYIEIDWKASSAPGANDGYVTLWVDGALMGTQSNADNDTKRVDEARFGVVGNLDPGTSGTFYLDKFESRKTQYIGP